MVRYQGNALHGNAGAGLWIQPCLLQHAHLRGRALYLQSACFDIIDGTAWAKKRGEEGNEEAAAQGIKGETGVGARIWYVCHLKDRQIIHVHAPPVCQSATSRYHNHTKNGTKSMSNRVHNNKHHTMMAPTLPYCRP